MLLLVHVAPLLAKVGNEGVDIAGAPHGCTRAGLDGGREFAALHACIPAGAGHRKAGQHLRQAQQGFRVIEVLGHGWPFYGQGSKQPRTRRTGHTHGKNHRGITCAASSIESQIVSPDSPRSLGIGYLESLLVFKALGGFRLLCR